MPDNKKIKLDILGLSSSQSEEGHFALVLGETGGNRRLPIIIDGYQARAIALEIENIRPNRPMTHDLIVNIAKTFNLELLEVVITELKEGIFYSKLLFEHNGNLHEIDSRTSDAVAIGVRFKVPVYTFEEVLSVAGIEVSDQDEEDVFEDTGEEEGESEGEMVEEGIEPESSSEPSTPAEKIKKLKEAIAAAIKAEDYEKAAHLRDEIDKIEGTAN